MVNTALTLLRIGTRKIRNWQCTGDGVVNEYFVRLTPDRQSKNGVLWSGSTFNSGEFVTTIKFRISGQVPFLSVNKG